MSGFGEEAGGGGWKDGKVEGCRGGKRWEGGRLMEGFEIVWLVVLSQKQAIN